PVSRRIHRQSPQPQDRPFFLAFLPQFVEVDRGHVAMQIAFLGLLFTSLGIMTDGCYELAAGTVGNWLKRAAATSKSSAMSVASRPPPALAGPPPHAGVLR